MIAVQSVKTIWYSFKKYVLSKYMRTLIFKFQFCIFYENNIYRSFYYSNFSLYTCLVFCAVLLKILVHCKILK